MRVTLQSLAASLGWGDCEIFPKQTQVLTERGDLGNWLNMPYLSGDNTERYGIKKSGLPMSLSEFLTYAESKVQKSLDAVGVSMTKELEDGPPCLQHLTTNGFPEGTRNNRTLPPSAYTARRNTERTGARTWRN
jgi:hypothetical protein